jgi:NAD(P)-dependent dehydrogenase (short-subunit alcohol dehydrogenase family)
VNVFGVMAVVQAILPHFRMNRAGLIVNVSSGAGVFTLPMLSLYCASKFAIEGSSEALSYELALLGFRVRIVEPGGIADTNVGERSASEAGRLDTPPDYNAFVPSTNEIFAGLRDLPASSLDDVAAAIYAAETDGSDRLRYVVTEDILPVVRSRRETSEQEYIALMRAKFMRASQKA